MIRKVLGTFLLLFFAELTFSQTNKGDWVDSVYNSLTLEQRLGQLFIMPTYGSGNEQHLTIIKNTIDRYTLGGVKIMEGNAQNISRTNNDLKNHANLPLLSFITITNGIQSTVHKAPAAPSLTTLGALQSDSLKEALAKATQRQMTLLGSNLAMLDVFEPTNADLNKTYFEWINLLQDQNLELVLGTYPGRFDPKSKLDSEGLRSFTALLKDKIKLLSISTTPSKLNAKNSSALSKKTLEYLTKNLNYQGLIMVDDMSELRKYKPGKSEALAMMAGCNLIVSANIDIAIKQTKKLIRKGDIPLSYIETSTKKVLALKHNILTTTEQSGNYLRIKEEMNDPFYNRLVQRIYQESMTAFDPDKNLPIRQLDLKNLASYSIGRNERFIKTLDTYAPFTHYDSSTSIDKLRKVLPLFDYVVVGVSGEVRQEIFDLLNELENIVIVSTFGELDVINKLNTDISKIVAYEHNDINEESAVELIFGAIGSKGRLPMTMSNLLIEGSGDAIQPVNRLEFSTAEDVCMDGTYLEQINNIIVEAIQDKATPGCQVVVARKGKVVFNKAFGYQTYDSIKPINANSIYDLASITKVAATTQAVMFLSEHQLIDLDKKVSVYLKDLKGTNKENMIIRDVLTHQAGLWPYLPFWKETLSDDTFSSVYYSFNEDDDYPYELSQGIYVSSITQDSVWLWVKQSKLREREPNITYDYKYSDMGYYMLQRLVEQLVNQPMEEFLQQNFYDPMGLATMSYLPLCRFPQDIIAPTENDNYFRKSLVNGWVHDQGAAMMGGVAGHAGLFSNALDLAKLMQMLLQNGTYGGERYFMPETIEEFTSVQYESNRRGIGWDKPVVAEWNSPTSAYASKRSFGHTGFTGTAVWADPEFDLVYVFLSNRIYPDATNRKLIKNNIRTRIQDLIYQAIWSYQAINSHGCN